MAGSESGGDGRAGGSAFGITLFLREEGGFSSVSVAISLLVSICLVFSAATAGWVMARSYEIQGAADASAMAGENVVAAYATIAQVLDACVLSMGIVGVVTAGAGLVMSAVPGMSAAAVKVCDAADKILGSRRDFARDASEGLSRLERALPLAIVANSVSCLSANSSGGVEYVGCAVPFPQESMSDFKLGDDVDGKELSEASEKMREASDRAKEARDAADALAREGWLADCGSRPRCMRERAVTLAGLDDSANPDYASPEGWNFGVPLSRARAYYAARLAAERPEGGSPEELTDSRAREAFYEYALSEVNRGSYEELPDGSVAIDLPDLPRNTTEVRGTILYTEARWPCTVETSGRTLHSDAACPGATGASSGTASLSDLESGAVRECETCRMSVADMGAAPAASTSIDNGFEYYWRRVCDASRDYEARRAELAEAERQMSEVADDGSSAFDKALEALSVSRPKLCPPGAWGCVAVAMRAGGASTPASLASSFVAGEELPAGVATSASVLAPDESTAENNVLSRFFDGLAADGGTSGLAHSICGLWGKALVAYGSAYDQVSSGAREFLDLLDGVLGGSIASRLRERLGSIVEATGFAPADLRMRKPVLVNSSKVLGKAGYDDALKVRELVASLPSSGGVREIADALGQKAADELSERLDGVVLTIAELPIPGTDIKIPLTINVGKLVDAL